ncbi:MAG: alpha/beta hydrolase [Rhodospirillales bacterium]
MTSALATDDAGLEHRFADNGGVRIHYVARGTSGPLLVMIHGFPDFWLTWRYQMPVLASDYRVVAMDLRGYNLSDQPGDAESYDIAALVGDVEAVIRDCGEEQAIIVGHDWGGAIAWALASLRPELVRLLVVLNLPHPLCLLRELAANPRQHEAAAYARGFQQENAEQTLSPEALCTWITDAGARPAYLDALGRSDLGAMLNYYRRNYPRPPYRESPWPRTKVAAPVLMIHGLEDPFLLPGALNGTWDWVEKDFTLVTVPGAGHWVHHDAADLVTRAIEGWLAPRLAVP